MIGGYNNGGKSDVTLYNIGDNTACALASFPRTTHADASAVTTNGIVTCGGETSSGHLTSCYRLTTGNEWVSFPSLKKKRAYFSMKVLNGRLWAFGGQHNPGTIEYIDVNNPTEWTLQSTPFNIYANCLTEYPNNRILSIGGIENSVSYLNTSHKMLCYKSDI